MDLGVGALDPLGVVAMHPVAQGLPIHAVERGRFGARAPLQNHRQGQDPSNLRPSGHRPPSARNSVPVCSVRVISRAAPIQCLQHAIRRATALIRNSPRSRISKMSQPLRGLV